MLTDEEILQEVKGTDLYLDASDDDLIAFAQNIEVRVIQKLNLRRTDIPNERVMALAREHNIALCEDWDIGATEPITGVDKYDLLDFVCAILKETEVR